MDRDLFFDPAALKPHVSTRIAIMMSGKKTLDMRLIPIPVSPFVFKDMYQVDDLNTSASVLP
jgi:hypothetical protein